MGILCLGSGFSVGGAWSSCTRRGPHASEAIRWRRRNKFLIYEIRALEAIVMLVTTHSHDARVRPTASGSMMRPCVSESRRVQVRAISPRATTFRLGSWHGILLLFCRSPPSPSISNYRVSSCPLKFCMMTHIVLAPPCF